MLQSRHLLIGILIHGPELEKIKDPVSTAGPFGNIKNRTAGLQLHRYRDQHEKRRQHEKPQGCNSDVESPFAWMTGNPPPDDMLLLDEPCSHGRFCLDLAKELKLWLQFPVIALLQE